MVTVDWEIKIGSIESSRLVDFVVKESVSYIFLVRIIIFKNFDSDMVLQQSLH